MDGIDGMEGWSPGGVKYSAAYAAYKSDTVVAIQILPSLVALEECSFQDHEVTDEEKTKACL